MPPQSILKPTIKSTVQGLMTGRVGKTRQKGILTLAHKRNIPRQDARFIQAKKIAIRKHREQ